MEQNHILELKQTTEQISFLERQLEESENVQKQLTQQQNQMQIEQNIRQRAQEKDQQKFHELQCQIQEKDMKISYLEGKMEVTSSSLKLLQESFTSLNKKETTNDSMKMKNHSKSSSSFTETRTINMHGMECTKQDLIDIIETYVWEIEALHQEIYKYK